MAIPGILRENIYPFLVILHILNVFHRRLLLTKNITSMDLPMNSRSYLYNNVESCLLRTTVYYSL